MTLDLIKQYIPAWAFALILMVLSVALSALAQYLAGGDWANILFAVLSSLVGVGVAGAAGLGAGGTAPPTDPTATAPVTP